MSKPIEPGCVCVLVNVPNYPQSAGRMVVVLDRIWLADIYNQEDARKFGTDDFWWVRPLAGMYHTNNGITDRQAVVHVTQLRRIDDDDTAEPRITEREIEHV